LPIELDDHATVIDSPQTATILHLILCSHREDLDLDLAISCREDNDNEPLRTVDPYRISCCLRASVLGRPLKCPRLLYLLPLLDRAHSEDGRRAERAGDVGR
jgi:hypothetical protein